MAAGDWKAMFSATQDGNLDLVKYYLKEGVNPNYQHPELLSTPLIVSIEAGHLEITRFLLENGADPLLKAGFSTDTPMKVARRLKNMGAVDLLKPYYPSLFRRLFSKSV